MSKVKHPGGKPTKFKPLGNVTSKYGQVIIGILCCALLLAVVLAYPSFQQCVFCNIIDPFIQSEVGNTYLMPCSNVRQRIISMENVVESSGGVEGYTILTLQDPEKPGTIQVSVTNDRRYILLYPRMSGKDSSIEVWVGSMSRPMASIRGKSDVWNSIGEQHFISLYCEEFGFKQDYDVLLRIVLEGRWAQVWIKDGMVFF